MELKKEGAFFSIDALIAVAIIFLIIIIAFPIVRETRQQTELHYDIIKSLSSLKVGDYDNVYVQSLITSGLITDKDKTLLEQIGEFYITNPDIAKNIGSSILSGIKTNENIGIWYGTTLIASKNSSSYNPPGSILIDTARQAITGIQNGTNVTGFSARAFLSSGLRDEYFYFGGYVGDGNISTQIEYSGNITGARMELAINHDFKLYVNNILTGSYPASPSEFTPGNYSIPISNFNSGENLIEIKGNNLHIAGGFIKITYEANVQYEQPQKYKFPGITGLINLYDGFYIPAVPNHLSISLHLNTNGTAVLFNIGNVTLYNSSTSQEETITFSNSQLSSVLDYNSLAGKTTPLRLGLQNVSFISNGSRNADVFSVTDISGSMGGQKIADAKAGNNLLIDVILNYSGNKVGLSGYDTWARKSNFHSLSNNNDSLKSKVNSWNAGGYTCICCGILKAVSCFDSNIFLDNFNSQTNGSNPIGWDLSEGNGKIDISSPGLEGDRAVSVSRVSSQNPLMSHYFAPQEDKISFEFLVRHNSGSGRVRIELEGATSGFSATFEDYIIIKMYSGSIRNDNTAVASYSLNTIYKIKAEVVPGANTYDLYVNDVLAGDNLPVSSVRDNVARVSFTTESSSVNYNADDIKVFLTNEICETPSSGKTRAMIVMSDGAGNRACGLDPVQDWNGNNDVTDDPSDHAIQAACNAYQKYNITVHAVGFGNGADEATLQAIAACGNGSYYFSEVGDLADAYRQLAEEIVQTTFNEQTVETSGNITTILYPDSYIEFNYTSPPISYGLIVTKEEKFDNDLSCTFNIPQGSTILKANAVSYSGTRWTDKVIINNNEIYNLAEFSRPYIELGDPYSINIPAYLLNTSNTLQLTTGLSPGNSSSGSASNKVIYALLTNVSGFSPIAASANGCLWSIQFEDYSNLTALIPSNYTGGEQCYYQLGRKEYNNNDAIQAAVYNLLAKLDLDSNDLIDTRFAEQNLEISTSEVTGIPYAWSTEVQVRVWR